MKCDAIHRSMLVNNVRGCQLVLVVPKTGRGHEMRRHRSQSEGSYHVVHEQALLVGI